MPYPKPRAVGYPGLAEALGAQGPGMLVAPAPGRHKQGEESSSWHAAGTLLTAHGREIWGNFTIVDPKTSSDLSIFATNEFLLLSGRPKAWAPEPSKHTSPASTRAQQAPGVWQTWGKLDIDFLSDYPSLPGLGGLCLWIHDSKPALSTVETLYLSCCGFPSRPYRTGPPNVLPLSIIVILWQFIGQWTQESRPKM